MTQQSASENQEQTICHTYPLCEATYGLEFTIKNNQVVLINGDKEDIFSLVFSCPKGASLGDFNRDPDWLRLPVVCKSKT